MIQRSWKAWMTSISSSFIGIRLMSRYGQRTPAIIGAFTIQTGRVIIFHSHHADKTGRVPFHLHGRANSLRQAVRSIQKHDRWQMQGRPGRRKTAAGV